MKIAGYDVELITRETAKVGCTIVTRAEAEALLEEMNKIPVTPKREEIEKLPRSDSGFLSFAIRFGGDGWVSVSRNKNSDGHRNDADGTTGYNNAAAFFCLRPERAEKLLKFLTEQLGYVAYPLPLFGGCARRSRGQFVIHYSYGGQKQGRTGNEYAREEFTSFEAAQAIAEQQEREMGSAYKYWVEELH
jgi:hypothetical protein